MKKISAFLKKYWFAIIIIFAIIIKHIITINLPMNVRDEMGADEYLMLYQAENLIRGNYLGIYDCLTLVKGIGFPLFLTLAFKIGISYLSLYSIFYSSACLISLIPIKKMVKNKALQLIIFIVLLFCPGTIDNSVQLVYRNMLIVPQSLLLLSSLVMMYFSIRDSKKKLLGWTLLASLSWIFMWHTREDTIWSIPLVLMTLIVVTISIIIEKKYQNKFKQKLHRIYIIILPLLSLFLSIQIISYINYKYYGIYTNNQLNKSNYTKAVMLMMKVKPKKEIEHVEITRETLQRIYEVSPTFAELKDIIENDYENKSGLVMAEEDNGEINEDLITWELLGAANTKGYYQTAQKAERFWGKVYKELKLAIDNKKLKTRFTLPSRSLIPYPNKKGSFKKLINSIGELFIKAASYKYDYIEIPESKLNEDIIRRYETITGAYSIRKNVTILSVSGCVFSKDNKKSLTLGIEDKNNNLLEKIELYASKDVYDRYLEKNIEYSNAKKCRFNLKINTNKIDKQENIYFVIRDNENNKIHYTNFDNINDNYTSESIQFVGNNISKEIQIDPMTNRATRYIRIANKIKNIYSFFGVKLLYIGLIYYLLLTIKLIKEVFQKNINSFEKWIYLSAILGSIFVIILGLSYVNAFMFNLSGYLNSSIGLLNLFTISTLIFLMQDTFLFSKNNILKKLAKSKNRNIKEIANILLKCNIKKLFKEKTDNTLIQFFRYLFVGGFAAVVNIGMLYILTSILHFYYILSNILAFLLGLMTNYLLSKKFVFQEETSISKTKEFIIYAIIGIIGLSLDTLFIWLFTDITKIYYMISKIISTAIVFIWNFTARKILYKIIK